MEMTREEKEQVRNLIIKIVGDMDYAICVPAIRENETLKKAVQDAAEMIWEAMKKETGR